MPRGISLEVDLARLFEQRTNLTFFDVGANVGQTSLRLAKAFPTARIEAIEPVASTFEQLAEAIRGRGRIRAHCLALGERIGEARMTVCEESTWNRIVDRGDGGQQQAVAMTRLDAFCEQQGVAAIDLLKIDAEGYELPILQGAAGLLGNRRVGAVYCEVNFRRDGGHGDYFAIEDYLRAFALTTFAFYDYSGWRHDSLAHGFTNALFLLAPSPV
jgi:FkbM family methyltransferase